MFRNMRQEEACQRLEKAGVPFAPINRPTDLFEDPHLNSDGGLLPVTMPRGAREGEQVKLPALPLEMGGDRMGLDRDLPGVGEDSRSVLSSLGYADDEIERLIDQGKVQNS